MLNILLRNSLYKFLNDGLDTFLTYDIGQSELTDTIDLSVSAEVTAGTDTFILTQYGVNFTSDKDLLGLILVFDTETAIITTWNNATSTVEIDTAFTQDILVGETLTIQSKSLIYMRMPFETSTGRLYAEQTLPRFDLFIKTRNDNSKTDIYSILQNIKNLIKSNNSIFKVYKSDLVTILGYGRIKMPYEINDITDISTDLQSFLFSFVVSYHINYI